MVSNSKIRRTLKKIGPTSSVYYELEIPDESQPIPIEERGIFGSAYELMPLSQGTLQAADLIGRKVTEVSTILGESGMSGCGFFGLRLETEWLVVPIHGAGAWIKVNDRIVEDYSPKGSNNQPPWITEQRDELSPKLVGAEISGYKVDQHSLCITFVGGMIMKIDENPETRPIFPGTGELRSFLNEDDLRKAICLSPSDEIWS